MTALVAVETVVLLALVVLVAGLLRSHAAILRRLHEIDEAERSGNRSAATPAFRPMPGMPAPADHDDFPSGADLSGTDLNGDAVGLRVVGVDHDTVIAFLSSGCSTCQRFWTAFAQPGGVPLPDGTRLVVAVKDPAEESIPALIELAAPGLPIVHSSAAYSDYRVPGSPYFALVEGTTGRVRGEGTGLDWDQIGGLLAQATGDLRWSMGEEGRRIPKPKADADRELDLDRALLAVGIAPGDPSLYQATAAPELFGTGDSGSDAPRDRSAAGDERGDVTGGGERP